MDAKKSSLRSWDSNDDFLRRILKQHSSSQATVQILQSQLQRLKTLKGTSKESLQKSKYDEELMENSTNDLILSTSQTFDTTNKQQDGKLLCSTMMYNKANNLNHDTFGDDFSPIKENVKIEEFIDSQDNLLSEDPASHNGENYECEEKVDELSSLFETIMKTGEKLKKELKDSRRRERILSEKLSDSKSKNSHLFYHTKSQPPCGGDGHDVTDQLDLKFQCSKLENALLSLQNENLKLNRVLKSHRPSPSNYHKLPEVADVISRLRDSEIEKVEMRLEMEKMKNFIKESNMKKCSCDRMKVDELKSSLRKSHEMLEEGIDQRKQLHTLLAHKESQLTDMQVKIDKLECALQKSTNEVKKLQQQDSSKSTICEKEVISKKEIEELLANYEKLKEVHLQTLKDFHELGRRVKEEADEKAKQICIEKAKKSVQTEKPRGGKVNTCEIFGENASSVAEELSKARSDYPSYLQLRADQVIRRNRHHNDVSTTSRSADGTFVEESTPRCKLKIASTISTSSCINDLVNFRPDCLQSTPIKTKEEKSQTASLPHHQEFCTRNTHTTGTSCSTQPSTTDLPTDTMSLLEKFHDFTVALVDQEGLANSAARQTSTYQRDLQVDELLRHNDVITSRDHHQQRQEEEEVKGNEIGFSNSQQEYVDGLVEKYNRLARDRW